MVLVNVKCSQHDAEKWLSMASDYHVDSSNLVTSDSLIPIPKHVFQATWGTAASGSLAEFFEAATSAYKVDLGKSNAQISAKELVDHVYRHVSSLFEEEDARYDEVVGMLTRSMIHYGDFLAALEIVVRASYPAPETVLARSSIVLLMTLVVPLIVLFLFSSLSSLCFAIFSVAFGLMAAIWLFRDFSFLPYNDASNGSVGRRILEEATSATIGEKSNESPNGAIHHL